MISRLGDLPQSISATAWIAPTAVVVGDVTIGADVGVWYNAVVRADTAPIAIADGTNVQDGCVIHADPGFPTSIGRGVTVGHNATLHGCRVDDHVLIGMGAILLNGAHVAENCIVAAGSLVPQGMQIPTGSMVAGVPAKVKRLLTDLEIHAIRENAASYILRRHAHAHAHELKQRPSALQSRLVEDARRPQT